MSKRNLKVLQLGKFYPIRGGVEKVMYDLMNGLSEKGVHCDMLCAADGKKGYTDQTGCHHDSTGHDCTFATNL